MRRLLYQDESRLEYGRRFWLDPLKRARLLRHWLDDRHPYSARFRDSWLLTPGDDDRLDRDLQKDGLSLRAVVKEIPPVFGDFFSESADPPRDLPAT